MLLPKILGPFLMLASFRPMKITAPSQNPTSFRGCNVAFPFFAPSVPPAGGDDEEEGEERERLWKAQALARCQPKQWRRGGQRRPDCRDGAAAQDV